METKKSENTREDERLETRTQLLVGTKEEETVEKVGEETGEKPESLYRNYKRDFRKDYG